MGAVVLLAEEQPQGGALGVQLLAEQPVGALEMQQHDGKAPLLADVLLLAAVHHAQQFGWHRPLLHQLALHLPPHFLQHSPAVLLRLHLNPALLLLYARSCGCLGRVGLRQSPTHAALEKSPELFVADSILDLVGRAARQVAGYQLPAVPQPDEALLQHLVLLVAPGVLGQLGVQVVSVTFANVLALDSRKGRAQLVPAQLPPVHPHQF